MKVARRRKGVGTLLIVVLIVLASLFVMAMMQFFASSVTKGKRILAHIAVTDYACEAAIDETVLWFKGHANDPKDKEARALHEKLVESGSEDATTTYKPKHAIELYATLHKDLKIEDVVVTISDVHKLNETAGELAGKPFFETEGIVSFSVAAGYESTRKVAVRSMEFRQVVVAPPQDFSKYQFVATNFGYLGKRVKQYVDDQSRMAQAMAKSVERIYFGFSMLTYIIDPGNAALGSGGNFMVGLNFIRNVDQAAKRLSSSGWADPGVRDKLENGMCCSDDKAKCPTKQCEGLNTWKTKWNNPNFSVDYITEMVKADTSNLVKTLDDMKGGELGFKPGDGAVLSPGDEYPLSPKGKEGAGETTAQVLGGGAGYGFKPAQKWGVGGKLEGTLFKQADIKFTSANGGSISLDDFLTRMKEPVIVVDKQSGPWKLSEMEFFIHPPPVRPMDVKENKDLQGDGTADGVDATCSITKADLEKLSEDGKAGEVLADFAGDDWKTKFADIADLPIEKYGMPGLSLWHPVSYEDWAFRYPVSFYKNNFSKHAEAYAKWKEQTIASLKYYKDEMEKRNADVQKKVKLVEPKAGGTAGATPQLPTTEELAKRASFVFPTAKDFEEAMKDLGAKSGQANALVMNGVYFIGTPPAPTTGTSGSGGPGLPTPTPSSGGSGGNKDPVNLTLGEYIGQGEIVAGHLVLSAGMKAVEGKGIGMVLHSSQPDEPFEITSPNEIDASIVTSSILKAKVAAKIKGVFVVKDALCMTAAGRADAKDEDKEVSYYYRKLPDLTIEHPGYANPPVEYSQMTFSSYRTSSGGARGPK